MREKGLPERRRKSGADVERRQRGGGERKGERERGEKEDHREGGEGRKKGVIVVTPARLLSRLHGCLGISE